MNIDKAEIFAKNILNSQEFDDKKDGLDNYRHIIIFLATDILVDVKEYRKYNRIWQSRTRAGILGQINSWTIPQIIEFKRKINRYIKEKWTD